MLISDFDGDYSNAGIMDDFLPFTFRAKQHGSEHSWIVYFANRLDLMLLTIILKRRKDLMPVNSF